MLIGMLHNRKDPIKVSRAYLYSAIAKLEGIDFIYFTTKGIDFENRKINGYYYDRGSWRKKSCPFPDVVLNTANQKTKKQNIIYYKLEKLIPYTSFPVGSKIDVYKKLGKSDYLKKFLIPYKQLSSNEDVLEFLGKYKEIIVKPIRGHHGENVIKVEEVENGYKVIEKLNSFICTKEELEAYLNKMPKNKLVQKYINSSIKSGEPFDFRLHLQKDKNAKWQLTIIVPRIGSKNFVITNISQGSQMMEFLKFIRNEYKDDWQKVKEQIETFAVTFSNEFEKQYPYYFDELGIDIGYDKDKFIWVYEVNWRPGHVFIEVSTAKNAILYAVYLANKRRRENGENISK